MIFQRIGAIFAIVEIPLAVSQPVTIPIASIPGDIPMDAANPIWESVPRSRGAIERPDHQQYQD